VSAYQSSEGSTEAVQCQQQAYMPLLPTPQAEMGG